MYYCIEMERAGKNLKVIWHSIEFPAYFWVSWKKSKQLQFQPWFPEGKSIHIEFCCWWMRATSEKSLLSTNALHMVEWEEYSSVNTAKWAFNLEWDIDETAKVGFVIHWLCKNTQWICILHTFSSLFGCLRHLLSFSYGYY